MSATSTTDAAKTIGPVTTSAAAGAGVAGAATVLIVWGMTSAGVDVPEGVSQAITTLLAAVGALVGGYLSKPVAEHVAEAVAQHSVTADQVAETVAAQIPSAQDVAGLVAAKVNTHPADAVVLDAVSRQASEGRHVATTETTDVVESAGSGVVEVPAVETVDPATAGPADLA